MKKNKLDCKANVNGPNYKRIYEDIIAMKYPDKKAICQTILDKSDFSALEIIRINNIIFSK